MKIKQTLIFTICALSASILSVPNINAEGQKRETRNVWLATVYGIDWPTNASASEATKQAQLKEYITNFHNVNINGISLQVRSMCDAMYKSSYEPWSSFLTGTRGKDPGWDPLAFAVQECHKLGMECHAWVNPYRYSTGSVWSTSQDNALVNSGLLLTYGKTTVLNPGLENARKRIVDVCRELITNYDIDGIIFDDYFYPSGIPTTSEAADYTLWKSSGTTLSFADWRRANVNLMVKEVYDMIQATKPYVKFSIGPAGVAGTASTSASKYNITPCPTGSDWQYDKIFSDPVGWLNEGTIDYISPQLYWKTDHSTNPFGPLTQWWSYVANHFGRHHYASHSISFLSSSNTESDWAEIAKQINYSRQYNLDKAPGVVFYSAKYICGPSVTGLGDYLKTNTFTTQSLTPAINWKQHDNYDAPQNLKYTSGKLSWTGIDKPLMKYSVYAVPSSVLPDGAQSADFEGIKSDYLLGITYTPEYTIPSAYQSNYWYAVCIVDGYGNEFAPATLNAPGSSATKVTLTSPINDAVTTWNQNFSWSAASNATYRLQISKSADFSMIAIDKNNISTNSVAVDLNTLSSETKYYWRITTSQPSSWDATSDAASFTTPVREKAPKTSLVNPAEAAPLENNFDFTCTKVAADIYTLQISKTSDFANISFSTSDLVADGSNMKYAMNISKLSNGTYFWRVITSKADCDDSYSDARSFTVSGHPTGSYEDGYYVQTDKATYAGVDNTKLTNNWIRTIKSDYANFPVTNNGLYNRGMIAKDNFVYISGRSENSTSATLFLQKYDGNTGEHISDITISDDAKVAYYPCNDVIKDTQGNVIVSNLTLNITTVPLVLFNVDVTTGTATQVASCKSTSTLTKTRVDHCGVYGDVTSGNFTVFAAVASSNQIIRWKFVNGTQTSEDVITVKAFYPSSATSFGIAPRIFPVDNNKLYVDGGSTYFTLYDFTSDGAVEDSFAANTAVSPTGSLSNGGCLFSHASKNFMLYPYDDQNGTNGYRFMLASADATNSIASLQKYWILPEGGLGNVDSQTWGGVTAYENIAPNTTRIYVYVPGNGLSAYTISDDTSTVIETIDGNGITASIVGNNVLFSSQVEKASIFDVMGREIASGSKTSSIKGIGTQGVILIKYSVDGKYYVQKATIK